MAQFILLFSSSSEKNLLKYTFYRDYVVLYFFIHSSSLVKLKLVCVLLILAAVGLVFGVVSLLLSRAATRSQAPSRPLTPSRDFSRDAIARCHKNADSLDSPLNFLMFSCDAQLPPIYSVLFIKYF